MRLIILVFIASLFVVSCSQKSTGSCGEEICTTDFAMVNVVLKDSVGNNFIPDKVETINTSGTVLHQSTTLSIPNSNSYTVIDDGDINKIAKLSFNTVLFRIYKNNMLVKTDSMIVSASCCHVFKQNGLDTIVVK